MKEAAKGEAAEKWKNPQFLEVFGVFGVFGVFDAALLPTRPNSKPTLMSMCRGMSLRALRTSPTAETANELECANAASSFGLVNAAESLLRGTNLAQTLQPPLIVIGVH